MTRIPADVLAADVLAAVTPGAVAAALALVAAAGIVGASPRGARARLRGLHRKGLPKSARPGVLELPTWVLVGVAGLSGGALGAWLAGPVIGVAAAVYGGLGVRAAAHRRRTREEAAARQGALDALAGLADDLRAGRSPAAALTAAVTAVSTRLDGKAAAGLRAVAGAAEAGTGVPAALRAVGHPAFEDLLARLAAVWTLGDVGVPLAGLLDRLDAELRGRRRATDRAAAQLAAARTTARLLAGLPVFGLILGHLLGTEPLDVLGGTAVGGACALAALALQLAGLAWVARLSRPPAVTL